MKMTKYDIKRVPREVLEQFVVDSQIVFNYDMSQLPMSFLLAYASAHTCIFSDNIPDECLGHCQLKVRQAARVKLRTRAEVDSDIAEAVREYRRQWICPITYNSRFDYKGRKNIYLSEVVNPLFDEETDG